MFISPVVDMENLILDMMKRANVSEEKLRLKKAINAEFTVMENVEHWFHTEEQMDFLDNWFKKFI